jgi:hypothetical protein
MAEAGTKEPKDPKGTQSSGRKNIRQNLEKYLPTQRKPSLSLKSASSEVKNQVVSTKPSQKHRRVSSTGEGENPETEDVRSALQSIQETLKTIVSKDDIRDIVKSVVEELKEEIKQELKTTIKEEIARDLRTEIGEELKSQKEQHNSEVAKIRKQISDKVDGLVMDNETNRDNIGKLKNWMSKVENQMKEINNLAKTAISMANFNHQYSQKNNIKILNWPECQGQKLKDELCSIVEEKAGVKIDQKDILAIHRIPTSSKTHPRPVIVKFQSSDVRRAVITKRDKLRGTFTMVDHLTSMNAELLRKLRAEEREHMIDSAWYYNGHIFAMDKRGKRHKLDVIDDIDKKMKAA